MRVHRITTAVTALAAVLSASWPARATTPTYTWTGNGTSNSWYLASNWGGAQPSDASAGNYVFAAGNWNATPTTVTVNGNPNAETLVFNGSATAPFTVQVGAGDYMQLSPSTTDATTISVAQTGVTHTIAGNNIQLGDEQTWAIDGSLEISASVYDDGESPPGFIKTGAGTLILSGGNSSFHGPVSINGGVVSIATIAGEGQPSYNLGRGGLTLSGGTLNYTGAGPTASAAGGFALGAGGGTIEVQNAATSLVFYGAVTGGPGGLTKTGLGKLTLAGPNNYTGATTVGTGILQISNASPATNLLTNAGGANVTGGKLVLDYNTGADPASLVQSLLKTAYNGGVSAFQTGQIRDSSATPTIGLGWVDNAATKQVTIMPAVYGDADLNGTVGISDLNTVFNNFGKSGMTWSQGDFDYNGAVGISDLNAVFNNFTKNGPVTLNLADLDLAGLDAATVETVEALARSAGINIVPEPSGIVLLTALALGGAWVIGRRRRNRVSHRGAGAVEKIRLHR